MKPWNIENKKVLNVKMPFCLHWCQSATFFLNFRFIFTISWVLFVRLLYWLNFVFVQLNIIVIFLLKSFFRKFSTSTSKSMFYFLCFVLWWLLLRLNLLFVNKLLLGNLDFSIVIKVYVHSIINYFLEYDPWPSLLMDKYDHHC